MTLRQAAIIVIIWALITTVFGLVVLNRLNLAGDNAYVWINPSEFKQEKSWSPLALHARWDSFWFLDVAENGYVYKGEQKLSNIVFFPLYPGLIWLFALVLKNGILAGWLVSLAALIGAVFYLHRLVREFHPNLNPYVPILLLLIFPTAFFLNAVYSESLFLFLSITIFYYLRRGNFKPAGIFGLAAALTRVTGIILLIPALLEYAQKFNWKLRKEFAWLLLIPAGTAAFFLYHYFAFGDATLFFKVQAWWGRGFEFNRDHALLFSRAAIINLSLDLFYILVSLIAMLSAWRERISYGAYVLLGLIVPLSTGTLMSIGRYALVLFPIYLVMAKMSVRRQLVWAFVSILLFGLSLTLFVNNYWAG